MSMTKVAITKILRNMKERKTFLGAPVKISIGECKEKTKLEVHFDKF